MIYLFDGQMLKLEGKINMKTYCRKASELMFEKDPFAMSWYMLQLTTSR